MEEPKRLAIKPEVQRLLYIKSGGRCAFPKCNKPIIDENNRLKGQICHIEAAMLGGERFNSSMTNEERRSFDNLILLCFDHHEETNNEEVYPVEVLKEMKKAHEKNVSTSLDLMDSLLSISSSKEIINSEIDLSRVKKALELLKSHEDFLEIKRFDYSKPLNYIKRSVYYLNDPAEGFWDQKKYDLIQLVQSKKRITILGVAGSGKSIELNYLAFYYSTIDNSFLPIKIRLNSFTNNEGIKQLLILEFSDFEKYKDQRLLIILDALDEVAPDHIGEAIKQISNLAKELPLSTIVVSCRNNLYSVETENQKSRISGFETYGLNPLTSEDIEDYCDSILGDETSIFLKEIKKKRLYDQLKSPFYLVHLIDFFITNGDLPSTRQEVFEYLIENRIHNDNLEKYQNTGLNINEYQEEIRKKIERLAISAESFGRNYVEDKEYKRLITSPKLIKLINYTFLFDKNKSGLWGFEHNNFQEYLAAKYLSNISFQHIKRFITFQPGYKKIKPTWVNTLSFLFSILSTHKTKFNKLLNWLVSVEVDIIIRFEKDHISLKTREKIFERIYTDFEKKKILIRSEKFDLQELANFVSDSHKIAKLLIKKSQKLAEPWKKSEALRMLPKFDIIEEYLHEIERIILRLIKNQNIKDNYKLSFFYTLADLNIYSDELTKEILDSIDLESSQYLRAGFYAYLINAKNGDSFIDIILNGISYIHKPKVFIGSLNEGEEEARLADEKYNFERLIEKFGTFELTKNLLQWWHKIDEGRYDNFHVEILRKVIRNSIELTNTYPEKGIYDEILSLLISVARRYSRELSKEFYEYFSKTNTTLNAFLELRRQSEEKSKIDFHYAIGIISDKACVKALLKEFKEGEISHEMALRYRNLFAINRTDLHDYYLTEINKLSNNAFAYLERNFEQEKQTKLQNDISLLLDKKLLKNKLFEIFKLANVDSFNEDELWNLSKKYLDEEKASNNIVLMTLRQEAQKFGTVNKNSLNRIIDYDERWYWFQIHNILEIDRNNEDFEFDENAKEFLKMWLTNALEKADFKTAIYRNENDESKYRYLEHFIPYISHRIKYSLADEVYLDFLYLIPGAIPIKANHSGNASTQENLNPSELNDYVVDKVGVEKASKRIINNIKSKVLVDFQQKYNHCKFCFDYKLVEGINLIKDLIKDSDPQHQYGRKGLITWYLNLSKETTFVENLIDSFKDEVRFHAIEELLEASSNFAVDYCTKKAKSINDRGTKFRYINLLFKVKPTLAFDLYKNWIIKNKQIPDQIYGVSSLRSEKIEDYFEIYEDALINDYGNGIWNSKNQFIEYIVELGSRNVDSFKKVKRKFEYWIKKYDLKFLYYQIQKLELEYYSNASQLMSIEEVIDLLDNPKTDSWTRLNEIFELRPNFTGIGINFNQIIELFRKRKF